MPTVTCRPGRAPTISLHCAMAVSATTRSLSPARDLARGFMEFTATTVCVLSATFTAQVTMTTPRVACSGVGALPCEADREEGRGYNRNTTVSIMARREVFFCLQLYLRIAYNPSLTGMAGLALASCAMTFWRRNGLVNCASCDGLVSAHDQRTRAHKWDKNNVPSWASQSIRAPARTHLGLPTPSLP